MSPQPLHVETDIYHAIFPRFDRPQVIGFIDYENLKFARKIKEGRVRYDLNLHYDKAIRKPEDCDIKLTELLKFLLENEVRLSFPQVNCLENAQFFCNRSLMTCVACTPYENQESWKIVAILHKGNIYLCVRDTQEKIFRKRNMTEQQKLWTAWGHKFEQYLLSDKPNVEPNPDVPVDETELFSCVFTTYLNNHKVVYRGEMDGIRCDRYPVPEPPHTEQGVDSIIEYLSNQEFIELKTNRYIQNGNQERNFRRFKAKKWWCQSFLVGIDSILCGFRDDKGIVNQLKLYSVKDLETESKEFWRPNVCFNFLDSFFTHIKTCLATKIMKRHGDTALNRLQTLPIVTMQFEWSPGMPVIVDENYSYEDDPIVPDWFLENYGKNRG